MRDGDPLRIDLPPLVAAVLSSLREGGDFLQRTTVAVLAIAVLLLGILPGALLARIIASLP